MPPAGMHVMDKDLWMRPATMNNEQWKQEWMRRVQEAKPRTPLPEGSWPEKGEKWHSRKKQLQQHKKARKQQKANFQNFFQQKQNEDGYPMKLCTYEPLEKRFVYRPPGYGVNNTRGKHCCSCHLKPCVADEYREETDEFFFDLQITERKPDLVAQEKTLVFLHRKYCKAIKRRYLKKLKAPQCVLESVAGYCSFFHDACSQPEEAAMEEEEEEGFAEGPVRFCYGDSSSEDGSGDDDDAMTLHSLLQDHECGDAPVEDKVRLFHTKKAQQQAVTKSLVKEQQAVTKSLVQETRSIQEWLEMPSDEENEF
jgi:hypothetical protein